MKFSEIQHNLNIVQERIHHEALAAGREPGSVKLVVVTKGQPVEKIRPLVDLGVRIFGENYADEALSKIQHPVLRDVSNLEWHMIGHIQSRKARIVSDHFDYVHSLDSMKLATRLDRFTGEIGRKLPVYLECNVSGEASKFGFDVWGSNMIGPLLDEVIKIVTLPNLVICGLMTMPPFTPNPEESRKHFIALRQLGEYLSKHVPQGDWQGLSMGMSHDYHIAIQEGATAVRIGQAILGPRPKKF